ncbi:MAG: hypothetical protein IPM74_14625 [Crocinitomicaceae bacterium]|nr:hypothetical protein [Crocinitomicaceae bacterium]MBK8927105.1 hypothetical protein [Crocinitomicaceae bacterium]
MNKDELQKIIDQLESSNSKEDAYFGIFDFGHESGESFVKANKEGLELFATELLKASRDADEIVADEKKKIINVEYNAAWIDGDTLIQYVQPSIEKRVNAKFEPPKQTWLGRIAGAGCLALILIAVAAFAIGLFTMFSWLN